MTDIDEVLAKLDKKTLQMVRRGSEISKERIPTASYGLNQITGGGLAKGKQHTFYGPESSGKSALMLHTIALNQALGRSALYIDAEKTFDYEWAARLGVDVDKLIVSQVSRIKDATNEQIKFIEAGVDLVVIDSTSFLQPSAWYDDGEMKEMGATGTNQIGTQAKDLGQMVSMVQAVNYTAAVVHLSQVRYDFGGASMHAAFKPSGGKAVEHADSLRIRLTSSKSDKEAIKGEIKYGDILIEERIGRKVTWKVEKNKLNGRYDTGEYGLYTAGDFVGVDKDSELLAYGVKFGVVKKGGAWFTIYDEQFQGTDKAIAYLRSNPQIAEKIEAEVNDKSV